MLFYKPVCLVYYSTPPHGRQFASAAVTQSFTVPTQFIRV